MPTITDNKSFQAFPESWLAFSLLDDEEVLARVEHFLTVIPKNIHGGLKVVNMNTGEERLSADRYGSTCQYLASCWLYGVVNIKLMSRDIPPVHIETAYLLTIVPPQCFLEARDLGQEAYQATRRKQTASHPEQSEDEF